MGKTMCTQWKTWLACFALMPLPLQGHAADSVSFEYGAGNKTGMLRLGVQWKMERKWWKSNGTHLGAYWDLTLAQWHATRFQDIPGKRRDIAVLGMTPVFRFQNDNLKGFYLEGGIGAHLLSDLYDNNGHTLSTSFQFGDHLGAGYVFPGGLDLALKIQHFSNGGIKRPNSGANFLILRSGYTF